MTRHLPVMAQTCVDLLNLRAGSTIIDATLGLGGHTEAILEAADVRVVGIDRDKNAIALAQERLQSFGERFSAVHTTYDNVGEVAREVGGVDGILMDLGVSSMQLDEAERGFSYSQSAPLDMRMDRSTGRTAAQLLATIEEHDLELILRKYGEEPNARRIARAIITRRTKSPVLTSDDLNEVLEEAIPAPARRRGGHPAKRTFQALRIAVNDELAILERAIPAALAALNVNGRLVVESYQSLEDKIVKRNFQRVTEDLLPADMPVMADAVKADYKVITRGALRASEEEIAVNPRSASVRIRAIERIGHE